MDPATLQRRLEILSAENDALRARVADLEAELGLDVVAPLEWRLTASETRVFGVLLSRPMVTKKTIMSALYGGFNDDEPLDKIVDVFVCKIRKKLTPWGVSIETVWGQGYCLEPATRSRLKAAA